MTKSYSKEDILRFLRGNPVLSAAMCGEDGPVSTVLLYAIDDDFTVYFAVRSDSFKAKALEYNPKVSMSVWKYREMMVQMSGVSEKLNGGVLGDVLDKLAESVGTLGDFWPPILRLDGGDYIVYSVRVDWVRALDLSINLIKDSESTFTEYTLNQK